MRHVGRPLPRLEDRAFLTGRGRFVRGVVPSRALSLALVRSDTPYGRLKGIDASAAYDLPGVVAVLTHEDLAGLAPLPVRFLANPALEPFLEPVIAASHVRYVGEPVAAVLAESAAVAEDGAELVAAEIEPAAPHLDLGPGTVGTDPLHGAEAMTVRKAFGDLNGAFHAADRIVEIDLDWARDGAMPLEPRGVVMDWDASQGTLTMWGAARAAHFARAAFADLLGLPRAAVRFEPTDVGGSFGVRGELSPEDVIAAFAARLLERPVRYAESRREHLVAASQGRGMKARARAAVAADGTLLGVDVGFTVDQGAYVRSDGLLAAELCAAMAPGPYRMDAYRAAGHVRLTNRTPAGGLRAAGRAEAAFIRERLMDEIAAVAGMDPFELRQRNLIEPAQMPADRHMETLGSHVTYDSGRYASVLDATVKRFSLDVVRRRAENRRAQGELVGVGAAVTVDVSAPSKFEHVLLSVDRRGTVELVTAAAEQGQGVRTMLAQIVADIVGVDYANVRVSCGDATRIAYGSGTQLSRSTMMAGTATQLGAEALRAKILGGARAMLGVSGERLTIQNGRIKEADRHFGGSLDLGDIAAAMEPGRAFAPADARGLTVDGWFASDQMAFPYGVTVAVAEIDRNTGIVRVPQIYVGYDVGNAINPALVEAQIVGGAVHGAASALWTSLPVDATGLPLCTAFADYAMPGLAEAPDVEVLLVEDAPAPQNALGMKGAGDGGITGAAPAVAAAIDAAIGAPGFVKSLPVSPAAILAEVRARRTVPVARIA